jgi:hypothetical protein
MLKFATLTDGKEVRGELQHVYYIPDIRHRLISGWEPRLSRNGLTLYDAKERLFARVPMKNNVYPVTLQTIYPDFGLITSEADVEVSDESLHERLERKCEHPLVAFGTGEGSEPIRIFDWHRRMGTSGTKIRGLSGP